MININLSIAQKKRFENPNERRKLSESKKRFYLENPEFKKAMSEKRKGVHHSEETKKKMSQTHKGKKLSSEQLKKLIASLTGRVFSEQTRKKMSDAKKGLYDGEKHPLWGTHPTEETRLKLIKSHIGKNAGDQNPAWKGGVSFIKYCPKFNTEFKARVRAYFNYICVECGSPENGRKHTPHHINYDKMVCCNDVEPLFVLLCTSCNSKANGTKKISREWWEEYFTKMIEGYYGGKCYLTREEFNAGFELFAHRT